MLGLDWIFIVIEWVGATSIYITEKWRQWTAGLALALATWAKKFSVPQVWWSLFLSKTSYLTLKVSRRILPVQNPFNFRSHFKMFRAFGFAVAITLLSSLNFTSATCYGPNACREGWVWQQAIPTDYVCVTPAVRTQTAQDNAAAASRVSPNGGPYGPDTCLNGTSGVKLTLTITSVSSRQHVLKPPMIMPKLHIELRLSIFGLLTGTPARIHTRTSKLTATTSITDLFKSRFLTIVILFRVGWQLRRQRTLGMLVGLGWLNLRSLIVYRRILVELRTVMQSRRIWLQGAILRSFQWTFAITFEGLVSMPPQLGLITGFINL